MQKIIGAIKKPLLARIHGLVGQPIGRAAHLGGVVLATHLQAEQSGGGGGILGRMPGQIAAAAAQVGGLAPGVTR